MSIVTPPKMSSQNKDFFHVDRSIRGIVSEVGLSAAGLYTVIKSFMDYNTRTCYPSHETLAKLCGCDVKTISRLVKVLEGHGMVKVQRKYKEVNTYYITNKSWWGSIDCLPNSVHMRCPEHDLLVITVNKRFLCPKCLMDVGRYCEEVLLLSFPEMDRQDIYGTWNKPDATIDCSLSEDNYWIRELEKQEGSELPVPDYQTKAIRGNFSLTEEDKKEIASIPDRHEVINPALYHDYYEELSQGV